MLNKENKSGMFIDCGNDKHEFIVADEYTGGTKYICKKCEKEKHTPTLFDHIHGVSNKDEEEWEYIMLIQMQRIYCSRTHTVTVSSQDVNIVCLE